MNRKTWKKDWKTWRPTSLQEAVEGCVIYAIDHSPTLNVDRIADLVGESKWTIYKWLEQGSIPARKIAGFEHACGCCYITQYLAIGANKLVIDMPTGRLADAGDVHALQLSCNDAVGALLDFARGECSAMETINHLTAAMTRLAHEREQVKRHDQPELSL